MTDASSRPTPPARDARQGDTVQGSAWTAPGTVDHFLAERYSLHTVDLRRRLRRADIHHPPWPLEPACAVLAENTMTEPLGVRLPDAKSLLHYAAHQDVLVSPLRSPTPRQDDERRGSRDGDTRSGAESGCLN